VKGVRFWRLIGLEVPTATFGCSASISFKRKNGKQEKGKVSKCLFFVKRNIGKAEDHFSARR